MSLEDLARLKPGMRVEVSLNESAIYDGDKGYVSPETYAKKWALSNDKEICTPIAGRIIIGYVVGLNKSVKNPDIFLSVGYFHAIDAPAIQISSKVIDSIRELR